jgi:hypothetical protein
MTRASSSNKSVCGGLLALLRGRPPFVCHSVNHSGSKRAPGAPEPAIYLSVFPKFAANTKMMRISPLTIPSLLDFITTIPV